MKLLYILCIILVSYFQLLGIEAAHALSGKAEHCIAQAQNAMSEMRFSEAIDYYYQLADLANAGEFSPDVCHALKQGGNACAYQARYIEALDFYTLCMEGAEKCHDVVSYCEAMANVGAIYALFKDYERAIHYYEQAYQTADQLNNQHIRSISVSNLVSLFCKVKN